MFGKLARKCTAPGVPWYLRCPITLPFKRFTNLEWYKNAGFPCCVVPLHNSTRGGFFICLAWLNNSFPLSVEHQAHILWLLCLPPSSVLSNINRALISVRCKVWGIHKFGGCFFIGFSFSFISFLVCTVMFSFWLPSHSVTNHDFDFLVICLCLSRLGSLSLHQHT